MSHQRDQARDFARTDPPGDDGWIAARPVAGRFTRDAGVILCLRADACTLRGGTQGLVLKPIAHYLTLWLGGDYLLFSGLHMGLRAAQS
jgi:hypothetical protein